MKIADFLNRGQQNATHLKQLVVLADLPERAVRRQIEAERKGGTMILSDCKGGYFLPGDPDELKRFSRSMARRANKIMTVAKTAEAAYVRALGQQAIEGWRDNE